MFNISKIIFLLVLTTLAVQTNLMAFADEIADQNKKVESIEPATEIIHKKADLTVQTNSTVPANETLDPNKKAESIEPLTSKILKKAEKKEKLVPLKSGVEFEKIESALKGWVNGDRATGDWMGLRTKLEEKGITFDSGYINDNFLKMSGGLNNRTPLRYQGKIDASLGLDTEKLGLWKGGKLFGRFDNLHGNGLTDNYIGDMQTLSNIDAHPHAQLYEYWYQQRLFKDYLSIKAGRQDANTDFCVLENAADYINSSFGIIPTVPIPIYPAPGLGISTIISPTKSLDIKYGFFDGGPQIGTNAFKNAFNNQNGAVHVAEVAFKPEIKGLQGKYIAGYWLHSGTTDEITDSDDPKEFKTNQGFYLGMDQKVFSEKKDKDQGLNIIGQFGWAPSDRNEIARYYGAGLKYTGLIPKRDKDITGIGTAIAEVSGRYKSIDGRTKETVIEVFHKIQLNAWLAIQPSFQYIFNPGGNGKNAFAVGLRTIFTL